jgi:hypothetical protein
MTTDVWKQLLQGNEQWPHNWSLGGCEFYGEIMDSATFGVWLSTQPISPEEYASLVIPDGFNKSGVGRSQHDAAFFSRPPQANADGPVETVSIGDHTFACVARPGRPEKGFEGVTVLPVFKTHRVLFESGRTLELIPTTIFRVEPPCCRKPLIRIFINDVRTPFRAKCPMVGLRAPSHFRKH